MNQDDKPTGSLADQAANWIPPWARPKPEPQPPSFPDLQWQSDPEEEPEPPTEPPAEPPAEPAATEDADAAPVDDAASSGGAAEPSVGAPEPAGEPRAAEAALAPDSAAEPELSGDDLQPDTPSESDAGSTAEVLAPSAAGPSATAPSESERGSDVAVQEEVTSEPTVASELGSGPGSAVASEPGSGSEPAVTSEPAVASGVGVASEPGSASDPEAAFDSGVAFEPVAESEREAAFDSGVAFEPVAESEPEAAFDSGAASQDEAVSEAQAAAESESVSELRAVTESDAGAEPGAVPHVSADADSAVQLRDDMASRAESAPGGDFTMMAETLPGVGPETLGEEPAAPEGVRAEMTDSELRGAVEAILLVVDEPTSEVTLAQVLEQPVDRVLAALEAASAQYTSMGFGFDLRRVAGGWRLYTRPEYASYVEKFVLDGQQIRLTQAALETLAVVAYKQPVTRSRISAIRGVNCDGVVRTLVTRGLIEETGSEPESGAFLYRTTSLFLEKLGLDNVDQLPPLAPFLPDDIDEIADAQR